MRSLRKKMRGIKELFLSGEGAQAVADLTNDEDVFLYFNQSAYRTLYFDLIETGDAEAVKVLLEGTGLDVNGEVKIDRKTSLMREILLFVIREVIRAQATWKSVKMEKY